MLPVLRLIAEGHSGIPACLPHLIERCSLSDVEAQALLPSGKQTLLANRAHWARHYMAQAGLVAPSRRGHYGLTAQGQALLDSHPAVIDKAVLLTFPAFRDWMARSASGRTSQDPDAAPAALPERPERSSPSVPTTVILAPITPQEQMDLSFEEISQALQSEILTNLLRTTPQRFERLIVSLLLAMGYGGGQEEMGRAMGRSNDGGIDGIVKEDALGLDAVYLQAKRYAPENTIGSPVIREFVGALLGVGALKGVFVTTSDFSREAREYAARVPQRIALINGRDLARLMILHSVGVQVERTYEIKAIDHDFFVDS